MVGWLVVFVAATRKNFGSSSTAFLIGLLLFAGSLLTKYKYRSTRSPVVNPDLEQHIQEFGFSAALVRQYYVWGLLPPFVHAAFRLFA
ncbi:MAG TPA: hypothetical protein VE981_24155 [Planctomycetota bacterium]|nr:hypothetical protein [Planctomycetota bacterium]